MRAADAEATRLKRLLRQQGTVDAVHGDEREQARFSKVFIAVLLRLDAVPGHYPAVRDAPARHRPQELFDFDAVVVAPEVQGCRRLGYGVLLEPLAE